MHRLLAYLTSPNKYNMLNVVYKNLKAKFFKVSKPTFKHLFWKEKVKLEFEYILWISLTDSEKKPDAIALGFIIK